MEGGNAVGGGGYGRERKLYICWGGLLEEGLGEKLCYQGEEGLCVGEGEHRYMKMKRAKGSEGGVAVEMVGGVDQQSVLVMLRRGERGGVADHVVSGHIQKLGLKVDKRKAELQKWKNGVGDRVEKKLRKTLANIGSVADVKLLNTALGKYGVLLMNNRSLVVNLAERKCSCK
ncbi:hypothetical protein Cgig2_012928 [Carnegiea gigantea]|uniref:Uncharacterized protein n=1 Tax=Carnegiea gigantea TaxID=171969 RepID=A0A9Q1Q6N5_9CARY|nr:hypothetical protein Cgig2_012928 [Carnegiea gigantea]